MQLFQNWADRIGIISARGYDTDFIIYKKISSKNYNAENRMYT